MNEEKLLTRNVFVYGTLMSGESRNQVLARFSYQPAILMKYRKIEPPSLGFPFIIRDPDHHVNGEIYFNITPHILAELDMIEGEGSLYHRITVQVRTPDNTLYDAYTYFPSKALIDRFI